MAANRALIGILAAALFAAALFVIFGDEIGRRALPPQANAPRLPEKVAPAAPVASQPSLALLTPSFDVVRVGRDCRAVIAGRAAPGAMVVVREGEAELGRVTADARGEWALVPDLPLRSGSRHLTLVATLGNQASVESDAVVIVSVPECAPGQPASGEQVIAVLTPHRGASRLLQVPGGAGDVAAAKGLSLDTMDYDEAGNLVLSGRATPNQTVQIYVNNEPNGTAVADSKGGWQLKLDESVPPGVYTLRIDQVTETGKVHSRLELPFSRATQAEIDFKSANIVVQPGNSLWRIARRVYGEGTKYTVIYRANQDQIGDADLIYPGQVFTLPVSAETKK